MLKQTIHFWIEKKTFYILILTFLFAGIAYDFPDSGGRAGNTTTSEAARKVFMSKELRDRLVNLCPPLYKAAYEKILANDLTILRLMSCRYEVLVDKIGKLEMFNPNF